MLRVKITLYVLGVDVAQQLIICRAILSAAVPFNNLISALTFVTDPFESYASNIGGST